MAESNRIRQIDIVKGIAIVLVVIGHSIPDAMAVGGIVNPYVRLLHSIIYSFHMPLFFIISGYFLNTDHVKGRTGQLIWKKFNRLMVPYFFVGLVYAPFKLLLSKFANDPLKVGDIWKILMGKNPDGELWFLYSLFIISLVIYILRLKVNISMLMVSFFVALISYWEPVLPAGILFFQFFVVLGMYVRQNHPKWIRNISGRIVICSLIAFIILNFFFYKGVHFPIKLFSGVFGSILSIYVAQFLGEIRESRVIYMIELAGKYCMEIYLLSDIIKVPIRILLWSKLHLYYTTLLCCTLISTIVLVLVKRYITRNWVVVNWLLFGDKSGYKNIGGGS
ncbi:MAG: acyltransferase family protein [Dialister invisus]|uniref:Acyltransferase family protein n=1 Tax=Dialister invisus TaxID=218538 RepID=A0A930B8X4_9FIRM|nr:acyltransferase family protein [Dialister invisus]